MGFNWYINDINGNSLSDYVNIKIALTDDEYKEAEITTKNLNDEGRGSISLKNVPNLFNKFKVLSVIPYFAIIGVEFEFEGEVYKIQVKIKDNNFEELLATSTINMGNLDRNLIFLFYRGYELYLSPNDSTSGMYVKAKKLKMATMTKDTDKVYEPKPNYVYRLKNGLLAIHLDIIPYNDFSFTTIKPTIQKSLYVYMETTFEDFFRITSDTNLSGKIKYKYSSPYILELGENIAELDIEEKLSRYKVSEQYRLGSNVSVHKKLDLLLNEHLIAYIKSIPKTNSSTMLKYLTEDIARFYKENKLRKVSEFRESEDKGRIAIIKMITHSIYKGSREHFFGEYESVFDLTSSSFRYIHDFFYKSETMYIPSDYIIVYPNNTTINRYIRTSNFGTQYQIGKNTLKLIDTDLCYFIRDLIEFSLHDAI